MKHIASVSFGKDSLAMLLKLIELKYPLDEVVFYDTGMEFNAIYNIRDQAKIILNKHNIKYTELYPDYDFQWKMFSKPVNGKNGFHYGYSWCGGACRWGTTDKLQKIEKYCKGSVEYVGIAADEEQRLAKERKGNKVFPLAELHMTEADCIEYCHSKGFFWSENGIELYQILDRVSCWCCCNKNLKELKNIYKFLPEYWNRLKELQAKTERPMKGEGKSVFQLEERFKKELEKEKRIMELKMNEYQLPEKIQFNFEELKTELTAKVSMYETMVYTEENIKDAKADRANLNKLKKALNDERIRREKEYMVPFNAFKAQINEIISIIDKPCMVIDKQVKAFEDQKKQNKLDEITHFFNSTEHPEWLHIAQIMDEKWLNASTSMKSIQEEILLEIELKKGNIEALEKLPNFSFEAIEIYKESLDMNKAICEAQRMSQIAKAKAEAEEQARLKAEAQKAAEQAGETVFNNAPDVSAQVPEQSEEPKQWVRFQAYMTVEQAKALGQYMKANEIEYKAV